MLETINKEQNHEPKSTAVETKKEEPKKLGWLLKYAYEEQKQIVEGVLSASELNNLTKIINKLTYEIH